MRSSGAISFSSAATSSCAIALSSVSCCVEGEILERRRGVLARQEPEHDDLILDTEVAEQAASVRAAGCESCPAARVIARADNRGEFVGRSGGRPDARSASSRLVLSVVSAIWVNAARTTSWWCTCGPTALTASSQR